jgi:hypothetical protein
MAMSYAIIRGDNGRRHEVNFGDVPIRIEVHAGEDTVEISVEADSDPVPAEKRRFAILNLPRHRFSEAVGAAARDAGWLKRRDV